ncbi:TerC family protein [Rhodoblastus sp.]|uniref:TerC family protein n=1 Tax=Rhodoblastus sp. TaxID=1962975 RepID=UPI00262591AC|nr:TerC family protein [Rhodoblastus sp.]
MDYFAIFARLDVFAHLDSWASLLTLTALEIVLGVDNLVFVALATQGLPPDRALKASRLGLGMAVVFRLGLLATVVWLTHLTTPIFTLFARAVSARDLILVCGGVFLLYKGTVEIHEEIDPEVKHARFRSGARFWRAIFQIAVLDIVFSLDSVLTAIGMADEFVVMAAAVIVAVGLMIAAAGPVARFIHENPTVKMLALAFLLLIGVTLVADGAGYDIPKGFVYSAVGFSLLVEGLNQWARRRRRAAD